MDGATRGIIAIEFFLHPRNFGTPKESRCNASAEGPSRNVVYYERAVPRHVGQHCFSD